MKIDEYYISNRNIFVEKKNRKSKMDKTSSLFVKG